MAKSAKSKQTLASQLLAKSESNAELLGELSNTSEPLDSDNTQVGRDTTNRKSDNVKNVKITEGHAQYKPLVHSDILSYNPEWVKMSEQNLEARQKDVEARVAYRLGLDEQTVKSVLDESWDVICDFLEHNVPVQFHGKGRFYVSHRSGRMGRNPETGETFPVPKRDAMAWRQSPAHGRRFRVRRQEVDDMTHQLHGSTDDEPTQDN